jgi:hypothetical protein
VLPYKAYGTTDLVFLVLCTYDFSAACSDGRRAIRPRRVLVVVGAASPFRRRQRAISGPIPPKTIADQNMPRLKYAYSSCRSDSILSYTTSKSSSSSSSSDSSSSTTLLPTQRYAYPRRSRQRAQSTAQRDSVQYRVQLQDKAPCGRAGAEVHVSSGEESEAVTKEEDESEDARVCDRTKRAIAEVGGAGREQGCVGAALQATKAGSW